MASVLKGVMSYVSSSGVSNKNSAEIEKDFNEETNLSASVKDDETTEQTGYLKKAVTGVSSGIFTVGTAGLSGVKWIAGTTYNVTTGVVGTAASAAGSVVGAVIKGSPKEHKD